MSRSQAAEEELVVSTAGGEPEPLLRMAGVGLTFPDGTVALDDVSMTLAPGEFVSVVGPSGCGKSTLLRIIAGLARQSVGESTRTTDAVGYVFQDPTLLPWRTVRRNVELFGELEKLPKEERRRRATEAVERVGLSEFARHLPLTLSGGMRMRASLARSLTLRPELFLFDEPFGALDEITRHRLGDELQKIFVADGFGALFVTHSVTEAVHLSTRVLVMSARPGRIVAEIPVDLPHPRSPQSRHSRKLMEIARGVATQLRRHNGEREKEREVR